MEVKGTAFLARRSFVEREHGAERFEAILTAVAEEEPVFRAPVLATTRIPMEAFLRFNQALIDTLYDGDAKANFVIGEQSAEWAFNGPYKHIVTNKSIDAFIASAPAMYRNYYDEGEAKADRRGKEIRLELTGIPAPCRSLYIEYGIMGYFRRGLEMVSGITPDMIAERGFSKNDEDVLYRFRL